MKNLFLVFCLIFNIYSEPVIVKDAYDNTVEVVSTEDFNKFEKAVHEYVKSNKETDDELIALAERVDKLEGQLSEFIKKIREFQKLLNKQE